MILTLAFTILFSSKYCFHDDIPIPKKVKIKKTIKAKTKKKKSKMLHRNYVEHKVENLFIGVF